MMRPLALMLLIVLACAAYAQEADPEPAEPEGIPADVNDYLRTLYPGLDPAGEHDVFALKDPKDKARRHEYTVAMTQLLLGYVTSLKMGATISKLFDQYSRGKEGNQVTFKVLHAVVLLHYPPGKPNNTEAQKLLLQATEQATDFAYPWYLLAHFFEMPRLMQVENTSPRDALAAIDKALAIKPDFVRAVLLKCQVYGLANPPRKAEIREMIAPFLVKLPPVLDDFEDMLKLHQAVCLTDAEFAAKCQELLASDKVTADQKFCVRRVQVLVAMKSKKYDDALVILETMSKHVDEARDPANAMWVSNYTGVAWGSKALDLRDKDPTLSEAGNDENFETWCESAAAHHKRSADLEKKHLPLTLRGFEARRYVEFMVQIGRAERALEWLNAYLKETDLSSGQRTTLDNLRDRLLLRLTPTEDANLNHYDNLVRGDQMEELAIALAQDMRDLREKQEHYKTERALQFFISQLNNRLRATVAFAAILAADTALQLGGEAIKQAGEAIATRYEKEGELSSDEQSRLHAQLSEALRNTGHRASQERGIRHTAKLIEESTAQNIRGLMSAPMGVWSAESYWKGLKQPPAGPAGMERFDPKKAAAWLGKLADAVALEK